METTNFPQNIQDLSKKAEEIYNSLPEKLKTDNNGKYISIENESGDYFVGETKDEAVDKASRKYPNKVVFVRRIGNIEKISSQYYACVL